MHAYGTQSTMFWRGIRDEAYPLWAHYIPELAVKYPWLMHGILTAAALHLAHIHRHRSAHFLQLADKVSTGWQRGSPRDDQTPCRALRPFELFEKAEKLANPFALLFYSTRLLL